MIEVGTLDIFNSFLVSGCLSTSKSCTLYFDNLLGLPFINCFSLTQAGHHSAPNINKSLPKA